MRDVPGLAMLAAGAVTAALLAGCSDGERTAEPADTASGCPSWPQCDGSPAASATSRSPGASEPAHSPSAGLTTPATSAGPLTKDSFPTPTRLGEGWKYAVDPGDAEEGYLGNGTPAVERDPAEVAQLAVPFGCTRSAAMPVAQHALEVDYDAGSIRVIAIRQTFAGRAQARQYFEHRSTNLRACQGRSGGQAIGVLVDRVDRLGPGVLRSDRTPGSDPWAELAVLDGDQVVLVAARTTLDRPPMDRTGARRLAALFRR